MPEVKFEIKKLSDLVKADWNYKEDDEEQKAVLIANMQENGYVQNMVVRPLKNKKFEVVDGNHRLEALQDMGIEEAMVCNIGEVDLEHAQRLSIQLNETRFESNEYRLSQIIKSLAEKYSVEDLIKSLPYSEGQIDSMLANASIDWDNIQPPADKIEHEEYRNITLQVKLEVHQRWKEWQERAKEHLGYESPARAFEFAIIEALNIPVESLK